ncbi:filamentous haemagglutinin family protein [Desulfobacterium sp. N47]|uniref:Filamentous haemagglutinin FhaB/tRNA nuclease CdiA-like TPS domain-containing protein n=1 Tax=uncultured Desulfobacterium sp. TaxID=201089 RepID=E1YK32_9BACT|nr:hypothetical protein N47_E51480 [uncultured Desulfobacterium sp.]
MKINKKENKYMMRPVIFLLILLMLSGNAFGGPSIPGFYGSVPDFSSVLPTAVPIPLPGGTIDGATIGQPFNNKLVINQNKSKAIIDWQSFNIGKEAWTHFNQQGNTDWVALNRIYDQNPSQIFGKLTADGKVYLINQNGILFGVNSQVNVHSLIASSLNANDDDFLNGALKFKAEDFRAKLGPTRELDTVYDSETNTPGMVSNQGYIETDPLGEVFLIAPVVKNSGTIISPVGQVGLAAGTEVDIYRDTGRSPFFVKIKAGAGEAGNLEAGEAGNLEEGWILTDAGLAGMYGRVVNQNGLIRSITAVKKKGEIELCASDKVSTGANSITSVAVLDSTEKVNESFEFHPGEIRIQGLDPDPGNYDGVKDFEHRGIMEAPSGLISITAVNRVYMEKGSILDISGRWLDMKAEGNIIESQLNSVELRDDYGQKESILNGLKIKFDAYLGSAIGDVSGSLKSRDVTALEQATKGGTITIQGNSVQGQGLEELIIRDGALINFTGGGIRYAAGHVETTKLKTGNQVYDISEAPEYIDYDEVLGLTKIVHERFGITEEYQGLYAGGANKIMNYSGKRVQGDDAGTLKLMAERIILDGTLAGSVNKSPFQTKEEEPTDEQDNQTAIGWKEPSRGIVQLGVNDPDANPLDIDYSLYGVVIRSDVVPLPSGFKPDDSLFGTGTDTNTTYLSSRILNEADLGALTIFINTSFVTEKDAVLSFKPDTEMNVTARVVDHQGEILSSGGSVSLKAVNNVTTGVVPVVGDGRVFLASGSKIDTSGERIDNFEAVSTGTDLVSSGHLEGGTVSLSSETTKGGGVIISKDSLIDVSGGYLIDEKGSVTGGDAGNISIALKSDGKGALVLDGDLKGYSLLGNNSGAISILARQISVVESASLSPVELDIDTQIPAGFVENFVLSQDRFSATGFTNIELMANYDLEVKPGAMLFPSTVKMAQPVVMAKKKDASPVLNYVYNEKKNDNEYVKADPEFMGDSSITLRAGVDDGLSTSGANDKSMIDIGYGSMIGIWPKGTIRMEAPGMRVAGYLDAPGGTIDLKTSGPNMDLVIVSGAVLSASGYNIPESGPVIKGYPVGYKPVAAGEIDLEASQGSLILESGSLVDVSGSKPVKSYAKYSVLGMLPLEYTVAGEPGSLSLGFYNNLVINGTIDAHAGMKGLKGGFLTLSRTHGDKGLMVSSDNIAFFQSLGFDALKMQSKKNIAFSGDANISMGRYLIMDAPEILGFNDQHVSLFSPWVRIINDTEKYDVNSDNPYNMIPAAASPGTGSLSVAADWIDIEGSMALSGFGNVSLTAANDIRVSDKVYNDSNSKFHWSGKIKTPGDLTLKAKRIYPTTLSEFTFLVAGKALILPGSEADNNPVYSAGGSLTIEAASIEHQGFLAAPLGRISLQSTATGGRVYLSENSVTTVAGMDSVKYGILSGEFWQALDRSATSGATVTRDITEVPAKSVEIDGDEVIVKNGALVDLSGGGSVITYEFLSSPMGSENPLSKPGRYVILPDNSVLLPGEAVYLEGGSGVPAGVYSLLPEEYAFLPGAMILTDLSKAGQSYIPGQKLSEEGYPVVTGYATVRGTDVKAINPGGYSIRSAKNVLNEGYFNKWTLAGGNAGSLSITGNTTILDGTFENNAVPGFEKGIITFAGNRIEMGDIAGILPAGFDFNTDIPAELKNKLLIQKDIFKGMDLREIVLGDTERTEVVVLKEGCSIRAEQVTLKAKDEIILRSGAEIHAVSETGNGVASLIVPDPDNDGIAKVTLEHGSLVHASDEVVLDMKTFAYLGEIQVDHSDIKLSDRNDITLVSRVIYFVPETYDIPENLDGCYIRQSSWDKFKTFKKIGIRSDTNINFIGDFNLHAEEMLSLDSSRITGTGADPVIDPVAEVFLRAPVIRLLYSGENPLTDTGLSETGIMNVVADEVRIGRGQVLIDGFSQINIASNKDTIFQGKGSLTTQANLNITAARLTTSYDKDSVGNYQTADFSVNTETGSIGIYSNGVSPVAGIVPGGLLNLNGRSIVVDGLIETSSVGLTLNATGSSDADGIFVTDTGRIINRGSEYGKGGLVELRSEFGKIDLAEKSLIDVSAGAQGDAGSIALFGPKQNVKINGELRGYAVNGGNGGSFYLDTLSLASFNILNEKISAGGFNNDIGVRSRTGDIIIGLSSPVAPQEYVKAKNLKVVSDEGSIFVQQNAYIDVSGDEGGGSVELYGKDAVVLFGGSKINAKGTLTGADGGDVTLGASEGYVVLLSGSEIDVSSGDGGQGGTVYMRAPRSENDVLVYPLGGTIKGASGVYAEAFTIYNDTSITTSDINTWKSQTQTYMNNAGTIRSRLLSGLVLQQNDGSQDTSDKLHFIPGIEIRSAGDLTLANNWDLNTWRFGVEPGVLTFRAGGNLNLNSNLTDMPNINPSPVSSRDSWAINMVAGADLSGADVLAVKKNVGTLAVADNKTVYTESAPLRFASGGNMKVGLGQVLSSSTTWWALKEAFNIGTFDGSIEVNAGGNLTLNGGAILSGTGDIDIRVGQDLLIGKGTGSIPGAILSMGRTAELTTLRYRRQDAGNIYLDVGRNLESLVPLTEYPWDFNYSKRSDGGASDWGPSLNGQGSFGTKATMDIRGIATLGGGDLEINTGGSFRAAAGSFGYVKVVRTLVDTVYNYESDIEGAGDLRLYAGGNVAGRFLVVNGDEDINALGEIIEYSQEGLSSISSVFEGFDTNFKVSGQGDVHIGTILNPTLVSGQNLFLYSDKASASIISALGNVIFNGNSPYVSDTRETILPPTLEIEAAGNINFLSSLTLAPSPAGNLRLIAGGDINGYMQGSSTLERYTILMSDLADAFSKPNPGIGNASWDLIHKNDPVPVDIRAGGDIKGLKLYIPKKTQITAAGNIYDVYLGVQNLNSGDVTLVKAGGDIIFPERGELLQSYDSGFEVAGSGLFMVQAGGSISLGDARVGLRTIGGTINPKLGIDGSALLVAAGFDKDLNEDDTAEFFSNLRDAISQYTKLLTSGNEEKANEVIRKSRAEVISMLGEINKESGGDILMLNSQISAISGETPIFILSNGRIDVGRTTFFKAEEDRANTGIYTAMGGAINIFSAGDVNVNESRIMTFNGGDMTIWADDGVINAGRGSKTVVSASPPTLDPETGQITFNPPAVGSGIRGLGFDPDGEGGPLKANEPGNIYLYANLIDAGEAGIAGNNLFLGSVTVLNAQNISFSGTGLGVPTSTESVNLGSLTGAGALSEVSKLSEQMAGLASEKGEAAQRAEKMLDDFVAKWLDVKFIGFDTVSVE